MRCEKCQWSTTFLQIKGHVCTHPAYKGVCDGSPRCDNSPRCKGCNPQKIKGSFSDWHIRLEKDLVFGPPVPREL